ncbi:hypothetical protein HJC23_000913 [Cyclotella cryptica]|uniref:Uncharacterized protein n=1 Tax=Cyclotella cryptica TaxID=29204 RepID=A0ABD3QM67_9STRA|eukprot:CCRYP_004005-RA/>CCRYP_004005-RA protein AED:0.24 eAED:0.24 QI:0/-1/0/1/-1/1/1/0/319
MKLEAVIAAFFLNLLVQQSTCAFIYEQSAVGGGICVGRIHSSKSSVTKDAPIQKLTTSLSSSGGESTSGLQFKASTIYKSKDAPLPSSWQLDELSSFFDTDNTNFHLLAKGTRNNVEEVPKQQVAMHLHRWAEEARYMGADEPSLDDTLISLTVTTPFLVFILKVTAEIGVKLLWHSFESPRVGNDDGMTISLPEYQFTLLDQTFSAHGPQPLVFIFNQLTGINRTVKGTYKQPNHALFVVKAEPSGNKKRLCFVSRMTAILNIQFPEILLNLLPVPKEKIENEGSVSLRRNMQKDVPPGVDKFRKAYVDWLGHVENEI